MMKLLKGHRFETMLIHAGEPKDRPEGAAVQPIYQSATFEFGSSEKSYSDIRYARLSNTPNHHALHEKLAALEGAEAAVVTASGMAAIATALLALLRAGDHILVQNCLYGGTHGLVTQDLVELGVSFDFFDATASGSWEKLLKPTTKVIYVETMSNPLLEIPDFEAVTAFARKHGLVSVIDNTFASPFNYRPIEQGFDLSVHSCTKYLNGHSDVIAGAVVGSDLLIRKVLHKLHHFGASLDPHACFLLQRGIKTLSVRMKHQNESALDVARFLNAHPAVKTVIYPGLESHPQHARAAKAFAGSGGVLSFVLNGGTEAASHMIARLKLPIHAPSLGGVESLIARPSRSTHFGLTAEERKLSGISDELVRLSVGLESPEDLKEDFAQALGDLRA